MAKTSNAFINNLPKIYGGYAGGFIGFVIILAILEQMGVSNKIIGYCFVFLTIAVYAYIGILSRTMTLNGRTYTIVGVMPPAFGYPDREFDIWVPLVVEPQDYENRLAYNYRAVAR